MKFQSIVIIILCILLVITLLSFYYIASTPGKVPYPKTIPMCPDYYYQTTTLPNGSVRCKALPVMEQTLIKYGKNTSCGNPTFTSAYYTGTNAKCLKYTWCKSCGSMPNWDGPAWDGITYGVQNPCASK
jgi:hypothetical protein